ncbi:MAG TPA: hypothetical protein VN771_02300 [Candidatus Baltobacteraceae bacterium]|nr:hypothetical protein [Candidatus Baltobacteraceae bacterium]
MPRGRTCDICKRPLLPDDQVAAVRYPASITHGDVPKPKPREALIHAAHESVGATITWTGPYREWSPG